MLRITRPNLVSPRILFMGLTLTASVAGCGGGEEAVSDGEPSAEPAGAQGSASPAGADLGKEELADVLLRERAVAAASIEDWEGAFKALWPLVQREQPRLEDLIRVGQMLTEMGRYEEGRKQFERAGEIAPDDPRVIWGLFGLAYDQGFYEEALGYVQRVGELAPDDDPTQLALANTLAALERHDEARPIYRALIEKGPEAGASRYASAVYRYHWNLVYSDLDDEGGRWLDEYSRLQEAGIKAATEAQIRRGSFGSLAATGPGELAVAADLRRELLGDGGETTRFVEDTPVATLPVSGLFTVELVDADLGGQDQAGAHVREDVPLEVVLYGEGGLRLARRSSGGDWEIESLIAEPVSLAAPLDVDRLEPRGGSRRDAEMDLVAATTEGLLLLRRVRDDAGELVWRRWQTTVLGADFPVRDLCAVDFDHEGDLDLLVVGPRGVRLLRNDGVPAEGSGFTDVTEEAGLPTTGDYAWCAIEDLDIDNDVDLLFGGAAGVFLARNERGGRFSDASSSLPRGLTRVPACFDVDRDGRPDLVSGTPDRVQVFVNGFGDRWSELHSTDWDAELGGESEPLITDLGDLDRVRALWGSEQAIGQFDPRGGSWEAKIPCAAVNPRLLALGDVSGDGVDDLVVSDGDSLTALIAQVDDHVVRLELLGTKDNRRGIGAVVELRAGPLYQRWFWDGRPRSIAIGHASQLDVVRVSWPNGVIQTITDLAAPASYVIQQREGLVGSCPFLYSWNGSTYEFISDVLGITPLGLPIDEGQLVPPDHDEYVLVRAEQLVPRDGYFELQFTEELREVTYLDHIRLDVVDHPSGVEILPNERFTFPPFPEAHTHTVVGALAPELAVDQVGRDWTLELGAKDERLARGFVPQRGQFLGLADWHYLELSFDADAVRKADKLRLLMTGWLYWTDASVNMASAGHPTEAFVPPLLSIPDGEGGWVQVGPPLGFPAGKLKTMVVDVTPFVNRDDPRLRISSSLALYWDAIRLAVDGDDAPLKVTSLAPVSGLLWERGFSEPLPLHGEAGLDWFRWDTLAAEPRWNQHPGLYTRFGETLPLLEEVDDRFVIMGTGDALLVRFGATGLPPLPAGWSRDFLVYLDGWAKDRDPNTKDALYVEPMPFHGMSGYPYGPAAGNQEAFPDTPQMRAWKREWNTRPAKLWIEPLATQ